MVKVQDRLDWLPDNQSYRIVRLAWLCVTQMVEKEVEEAKQSPQPPIDYLWKCALLCYSYCHQCACACTCLLTTHPVRPLRNQSCCATGSALCMVLSY